MNMQLRILLPSMVLVDEPATRIIAEAEDGSFCLLPRHIDFLAALAPGLLEFVDESAEHRFVAVDEGLLVKRGFEVLVSTRQAVRGTDIESLQATVRNRYQVLDDRERMARSAIARLESDLIRRFLALGEESP